MNSLFRVATSLFVVAAASVVNASGDHQPTMSERVKALIGDPPGSIWGRVRPNAANREAKLALISRARALHQRADDLQRQGNLTEAIRAYQESLRLYPSNAEAHANLADALASTNRISEAIEHYREAVYPSPLWRDSRQGEGDLQFRFALLLSRAGQYEEAIKVYEMGVDRLTVDPTPFRLRFDPRSFAPQSLTKRAFDAAALTGLALRTASIGDSIAALREATRLQPTFAPAYLYLGNGLNYKGEKAEARAMYAKAIEVGRGDIKATAQQKLDELKQ